MHRALQGKTSIKPFVNADQSLTLSCPNTGFMKSICNVFVKEYITVLSNRKILKVVSPEAH